MATIGSAAPPAFAARDIPIGVYNLNGARSQDGQHRIWAMRFVLDRTRLARFYSGMNWEGIYRTGQPARRPRDPFVGARKGYPSPAPPSDLPAGVARSRADHYAHGTGG